MYESLDKPALKLLPATAYQYAQWKKARVTSITTCKVDRHYCSDPHQLMGKKLNIRYTERTVEGCHKDQRVASHHRILGQGGFTTP
ncbi:hypothetical protein DFAR_340032 [Desulfarculales bacterium]